MKRIGIVLLAVTCSGALAGNFVLREENDVFAGSDGRYTQGLELMYGYSSTTTVNVARWFGVRNLMYTPADISIAEPQPDDRPWAGLTALVYEEWRYWKNSYVQAEYMLGVVGEWSESEQIQKWFHGLIGSEEPKGWDNQIPNEPFVNAMVTLHRPWWTIGKPDEWYADLTGTCGGSLGTAFVNVEVGGDIRAGWNVPMDYRSALIKPTVSRGGFSAYVFTGMEGRFVLHNVTLGGSLFQDGPSQTMEPFVHDLKTGFAVGVRGIANGMDAGLSYCFVHRSKEFEGQDESARFGSVTISVVRTF